MNALLYLKRPDEPLVPTEIVLFHHGYPHMQNAYTKDWNFNGMDSKGYKI